MIREQWKQMTPEQQRIKVAELAGWRDVRVRVGLISGYPEDRTVVGIPPEKVGINNRGYREEVPDFLNDLNAVHEAEKLLDYNNLDQIGDYMAHLTYAMSAFNMSWMLTFDKANWMLTFATAAQRAEAFVLTMDKKGDQ